jgi:hypothetical protein
VVESLLSKDAAESSNSSTTMKERKFSALLFLNLSQLQATPVPKPFMFNENVLQES